jgi:hypothetical protein
MSARRPLPPQDEQSRNGNKTPSECTYHSLARTRKRYPLSANGSHSIGSAFSQYAFQLRSQSTFIDYFAEIIPPTLKQFRHALANSNDSHRVFWWAKSILQRKRRSCPLESPSV